MEYIDVLDKNGQPTGEIKDRPAVHKHGNWHRTVHVWFANPKHELLIQKRAAVKESNSNMWGVASLGGHISAGVSSIETALAEAFEELGVKLQPDELEFLFTCIDQKILNNGTYIANHFHDVYLVLKDIPISEIKLQKEEVAEARWIPISELETEINNKNPSFCMGPNEYHALFPLLHKRFAV